MQEKQGEILFYQTDNDKIRIEVYFKNDTFWLPQKEIAALFGVQRPAITKHINKIFEEGELQQEAVCSVLEHTASDGKVYDTKYYNLDLIIAVGYRVNSKQATRFRIWATQVIKDFIVKGFVLDDERLKNSNVFGKDYFDELLERIREIRSSERRFYQKLTDIYALSIDYDPESEITKDFFSSVQINFIGQYQVKQQQKLFVIPKMHQRKTWD